MTMMQSQLDGGRQTVMFSSLLTSRIFTVVFWAHNGWMLNTVPGYIAGLNGIRRPCDTFLGFRVT
jgi:hypothetical protein